ncbi:DegT/DnrJ/EryC1/StrS aminotransferase family protein [Paenibacillus macerans]|uniref:DegT/DnrJ/EryC1/StrS family aminotransferase n=1 Tax=Paenibacillus macerans TaxID=44252 RepID=UPI00203BD23A|nr:DegT/DnrJ/EryC1/StrS family aminotransferase [Paenibacillus macerans]MCM3701053.1 DegT/DnrJ/EryC1/StrS family aminotransferase [Paenibacillus macerans]
MIKIPVYEPALDGNEKKYVMDCLESNWISSKGQYVHRFEDHFSSYVGTQYAVSTSNGTTALHLAMLALGIGKGDEIIVPTLTYISSVNCIRYVGATPVFVDSDPENWQLDLEQVKKKINIRTKAVIAVHLYGNACDLEELRNICNKHNIFLVEDCAEAIGTYSNNKHVGTFGDISTFSFFGNKTITTGEGGMVCTNNLTLKERIELFKGQGVSKNIEYWHEVVGYNYRMTNICAAIGLAQLERVESILMKKREIADQYKQELKELPMDFADDKNVMNSHWMVSVVLENEDYRDLLRSHLYQFGIETRPFFHPIHLMDMYKNEGSSHNYPNALKLSKSGINLPSSPLLSQEKITYICNVIKDFYRTR